MPVNRSDPVTRLAMWEAYGHRCAYCTRWIMYDAFQIDHVVPQRILGDAELLRTLSEALDLPDEFDYQGLENLIVTCVPCNRRKSDEPLDALPMKLALSRAKAMQNVILKRESALWEDAELARTEVLLEIKQRLSDKYSGIPRPRDEL